ncbi:MAG TPA: alpha/beta hydrolase [Phycisphaerales bacterium]|nr:alpha/beta hydrolase [Phycisphaerales bacterium]
MFGLVILFSMGLALAYALVVWMTVRRLRRPPRRTAAWAVSRGLPANPGEMNPAREFESFALRLDERTRDESPAWSIAGDARGATGGTKEAGRASDSLAPIIIVTPGWGDSRVTMLGRVNELAKLASRVIVWDPPGHGEAPGLCALGTREPEMITRLVEWACDNYGAREHLDSSHAQRGAPPLRNSPAEDENSAQASLVTGETGHAPPIVLFGFSLGAGASIVAAASDRATGFRGSERMPGSPRGASQTVSRIPQAAPRIAAVIAEAPYRFPWTPARNVLRAIGLPHRVVLRAVFAVLGMRLGVGVTWGRAHGGVGFDRAKHAAGLRMPLLILHGEADEVCPVADSEAIVKAATHANGTNTTLARIAGGTHLVLWSPPSDGLLISIADFIRGASRR